MAQISNPRPSLTGAEPAAPTKRPKSREGNLRTPRWLYAVMAGGLFLVVIPFVWMVLSSFKPEAEVMPCRPPGGRRRRRPTTTTSCSPSSTSRRTSSTRRSSRSRPRSGTWSSARCSATPWRSWSSRARRLVFVLVLGTLMVPGVVTFVPLFVLTTNIGLTNTLPGMFLPFLAGPFGVFLMRQYILGLPDELIQAARVDGASELRIFFSIILPLCGPGRRDARGPHLPDVLEQLPVAVGRRDRRGASSRCRSRSRCTPSARTPRSTACCSPARSSSCCPCSSSSWSCSAGSCRASP